MNSLPIAACQYTAGNPSSGACNANHQCVDANGESGLQQELSDLAKFVF